MMPLRRKNKGNWFACRQFGGSAFFFLASLFLLSCGEIKSPKPEPFLGDVAPPRKQEFRWSNGKMPKSFDPALASASPETDIVRAIYEGLTEIDPKTLQPLPAVAEKWSASNDKKVWTFKLRKDAKWSNGKQVTAQDFVKSWERLVAMEASVKQYKLLSNINGTSDDIEPVENADEELDIFAAPADPFSKPVGENGKILQNSVSNESNTSTKTELEDKGNTVEKVPAKPEKKVKKPLEKFGVEAPDNLTLKVTLKEADKDFPALVAHPIFRPVFDGGNEFEKGKLDKGIITNGAFSISSIEKDSVVLGRAANYWNKEKIQLESIRFVAKENAESALEAYRKGELDAITNASFEPLALKLLAPYEDLKRTKHGALNFYEFNLDKKPFNDRRVREALALSIDRERLTEDEMDGVTEPAYSFLPFSKENEVAQDVTLAKRLLSEAGYPAGKDFPVIKLLINRNDMQKRIAKSVARMWKKSLNIETEVIVKERKEFEALVESGDFDLVRRGVVIPTNDEIASMLSMFKRPETAADNTELPVSDENQPTSPATENSNNNSANSNEAVTEDAQDSVEDEVEQAPEIRKPILSEEDAFEQLPAIPLYFPTSYSLVKPYVQGFENNVLDAPSLKRVAIDSNWQPDKPENKSNTNN